jgi:hypothetical protein
MTATPDIGPLSWVKSEIDLALEQAGSELTVYAAAPAAGPLQTARARLHQAHGALVVVGLEGVKCVLGQPADLRIGGFVGSLHRQRRQQGQAGRERQQPLVE